MTTNLITIDQTMGQLYLDRNETGDITFLVENKRIRAHRSILATHSPKYKAQFYGTHRDVGEIYIPDVTAVAFNVFLQFFYKEKVDLSMKNIRMVLDLAKQSLVDEYVESCANFLRVSITADNLFDFYDLAVFYDIESLRLSCEKQISTNTIAVFGSDDFLQCDRDVLLQILKMDALNCNETDVFDACIAWARVQCKQNHLDARKPENLRTVLGGAIHQIRFSSINAEEFGDMQKSMGDFFTSDETIEILRIIEKMDDFKSQKFNNTQEHRLKAIHRIPCWLLQCNRYLRSTKHWSAQLPRCIDETDCLNFYYSCNKPIRLHGISFDVQFGDDDLDDFPQTITIAISRDEKGPLFLFQSKYKIYQNPRNCEIVIMFDKPIEQITYFSCSFRLPKPHSIYGPQLKSYVKVYDLNFSIYGDSVSRIFFDDSSMNDELFHDFGPFVRSSKKYKIPIYNWSPIFHEFN